MIASKKFKVITVALIAGSAGVTTPASAASTVELSYASVYGVNSSVIINRVPIEISPGKVVYKDITINLTADAKGTVTVAPATPKQNFSLVLPVGKFMAGTYVSQDGKSGFVLVGPSPVTGTSVSEWTIGTIANKKVPNLAPATFYVGPVAQSPLIARIRAAKITDKEFSYGTVNSDAPADARSLIGVAQLGKQIELADFTSGPDKPTPVGTVIYNFVK
jgi:hypothetical protein